MNIGSNQVSQQASMRSFDLRQTLGGEGAAFATFAGNTVLRLSGADA